MWVKTIIAALLGYLFGSISFAILISKYILKNDVRTMGSGNAGATNVARVFGVGVGIATLVGDAVKTIAAVLIGKALAGELGFVFSAAFCLIGHSFPVYYNFKGGKGVTVGATIAGLIDIRLLLILVVIFFAVALTSKIVSLSSITVAFAFPIVEYFLGVRSVPMMLLGVFLGASVIWLHRSNIKRLLAGTEPQFHAKSAGNTKTDDYGRKN